MIDQYQQEEDREQMEFLREWHRKHEGKRYGAGVTTLLCLVSSVVLACNGWIVPAVLLVIPGVIFLAEWLGER